MTLIKAIIMGIVQGVAEFLPVSSSGHLAIFKHILNIETDTGLLFDILLHLGTLIAIFIVFWKDIKELIVEGFSILGDFFTNAFFWVSNLFSSKKKEYKKVITSPYRRFVMLIIISTIPTGICGFMFRDLIEEASATLIIPGLLLLLTGVLLIIADRTTYGNKNESSVTYKDAVSVGLAQGIATFPGLSRSGTTITACLVCGFEKTFAVKYSFIMSIPAVFGAVVLELKDIGSVSVSSPELINYLIGTVVAAVVGYICIKTMLVIVRGKKFIGFSIYCFIVGAIAVIGYFIV